MDTPVLEQVELRFRNDDGDETVFPGTGASWRQDSNIDDSQDVDTVYRIRVLIAETAGFAQNNFGRALEFKHEADAEWNEFNDISSVIQIAASQLVNNESTTQQLGSGTFVTPNDGQEETTGSAGGSNLDMAGNDEVEFEYSYQIIGADVANDDLIHIRCKQLTYTQDEVVITVIKGGGPAPRRRITISGLNLPWWLIAPFYPIVWIIRRRMKIIGAFLLGLLEP